MSTLISSLCLLLLSDYQCRDANGCPADINVMGRLVTVHFRKGDIVSTEDGWYVSTEEGWEKFKPKKNRRTVALPLDVSTFGLLE